METEGIKEGYPLRYPLNWKRTPKHERKRSAFKQTFYSASLELLNEVRLMGGKYPVISSNLLLKKEGLPYSNQREPEDSGVAVYFLLYGKQQCIPCDKWTTTRENLVAITKTINALRGVERWGSKEMVEASFQGFQALPYFENGVEVKTINYFDGCFTDQEILIKYRQLVKKLHPDINPDKINEFIEMNKQYEKLKEKK
jgi:hypothetical protein